MHPSRGIKYHDVTLHVDGGTEDQDNKEIHKKLDKILKQLGVVDQSIREGAAIMANYEEELEILTEEVKGNGTVVESAITLIDGLSDKLDEAIAAGADPTVIAELSSQLRAQKQALAQAVDNVPHPEAQA